MMVSRFLLPPPRRGTNRLCRLFPFEPRPLSFSAKAEDITPHLMLDERLVGGSRGGGREGAARSKSRGCGGGRPSLQSRRRRRRHLLLAREQARRRGAGQRAEGHAWCSLWRERRRRRGRGWKRNRGEKTLLNAFLFDLE